jgi:O-antigen ligase
MSVAIAHQTSRLAGNWKIPLAFLLLLAIFICVALANGLAPLLWLAAPFAVAGFLAVAWYAPELFLVAAVFVPQWKASWPFSLLDASGYLTVLMLAGVAFGLACLALRISTKADTWTFRHIFFGQKHVLFLFGVFCAVVATSYLYTDAHSYGGVKLIRLVFIGGLLLVSPLFLLRTEAKLRRFARLFVAGALITALQMIIVLRNRPADAETDITRIGAGWMMGLALLLILFYPVFVQTALDKLYFAISLPLLAAGLVASAARGALFSLVLILPFAIFLAPRQRQKTIAFVVVILFACSFGAFLVLRASDPGKYGSKISEFIGIAEGKSTSGSASKRLGFYRETIKAIPQHLLVGTGVGSWSVFYYGNDSRAYPHNLLLEITFEEGVLGLAAFAIFFLAVGRATYRTYQMAGAHFIAVALMVLYGLIVSMFSGDLDDNRLLWLWAGITLAICRNVQIARMRPIRYIRRNLPQGLGVRKYPTAADTQLPRLRLTPAPGKGISTPI